MSGVKGLVPENPINREVLDRSELLHERGRKGEREEEKEGGREREEGREGARERGREGGRKRGMLG